MQLSPCAVIVTYPDTIGRTEVDNYIGFAIAVYVTCDDRVGSEIIQLSPCAIIVVYPDTV